MNMKRWTSCRGHLSLIVEDPVEAALGEGYRAD